MFVKKRIKLLREEMIIRNIQACIIPTSDPHQSEYTAERWKFREFISGFTGSAGTVVIGTDKAGLWVDSRYFIQAESELEGSDIALFKMGMPESITPEEWIIKNCYFTVGLDGSVFSAKDILHMTQALEQNGITLNATFAPYAIVWPDRPKLPENEIYHFSEKYCGETSKNKLLRLRLEFEKSDIDCMPITSLDEIAWLLNLRGSDVDYNPVGICYAFVDKKNCFLFADPNKLKSEVRDYLQENGISTSTYDSFATFIANLEESTILLDKTKINFQLFQNISGSCKIKELNSPISLMKAIKNPTEIAGFETAMIKDGVALVRFWRWMEDCLEKNAESKEDETLNEWIIGEKISEFRRAQENYVSESFCPIVGYNEHGAIVHYEATPESASQVVKGGFLLIDCGGQYLNGTTDITRSWSFYKETPANYMEDYTSLLKGVIALTTAIFPAGTRGAQLDILARQFIWKRNLNFWHGTGHGVGHFLNVHEGPQSIRMNENPTILEVGMILSNEPGIYRKGQYGIRIENIIRVCEKDISDFGEFLSFETLTLLPFDLNSIENKLLSFEDKNWINHYHQMVYNKLSVYLNDSENEWLRLKTEKII